MREGETVPGTVSRRVAETLLILTVLSRKAAR